LPCNILFGIVISFILSTCPNHCSLWALMNLIISSSYFFFLIWFVRLLALRPLLAYCASLG
jgi:hypothetical protein